LDIEHLIVVEIDELEVIGKLKTEGSGLGLTL